MRSPTLEERRLSNGDVALIDPGKGSDRTWRPALARAIMMRFLRESGHPSDRVEPGWRLDVIVEEINDLIATTEPRMKDLILSTIFCEDLLRLDRMIERKASAST